MSDYQFVDGWIIRETDYRPEEETSRATVFALANGYMGLRGAGEELPPTIEGAKGCYINGIYDTPRGKLTEREFPNVQDWTLIELVIDGEKLDLSRVELVSYCRELDMRQAVLRRRVSWRTAAGKTVSLSSERFLSTARIHLALLRLALETDQECEVVLKSRIDAQVSNRWAHHFRDVECSFHEDSIYLETHTFDPGYTIAVMAEHVLEGPDVSRTFGCPSDRSVETAYSFTLSPGETASVVKWAAIYESRFTHGDLREACSAELASAIQSGYEHVKRESTERWEKLWQASDVVIDGDDDAQMGIRFSLFHLLAAAPYHSNAVSIPARGLQGQDYYGSIFWDCEVFVLPMLSCTQPEAARNALGYRVATLDGARRKAASLGFSGAYYAWQSQETGDEQCDLYVFTNPITGELIRSYFADEQIHISADIAYAAWQYYAATGDEEFWFDGGAEMICEIARFFVSRATFVEDEGRYELLSVLGPDEYHERVDNNAFTNAMAANAVEVALRVLDLLGRRPSAYRDLAEKIGLSESETARWRDFTRLLYVPQPDPDSHLIEQFDGYFRLEDVSVEETRKRLAHPDLHPGGPLGPFQSTQNIKQADVVMLLYMLRDRYSPEVKRRNWEYYEKRTAHDSSLSPMAYSLVAADVGMVDWAYKYFIYTSHIDLASYGPHWNLGIHAASLGGAWLALVHGFCGVSCTLDGILLEKAPVLPDKWRSVEIRLAWHGRPIRFRIDGRGVELSSDADQPVPILHHGIQQTLPPRGTLRVDFS